MALNFPNLSRSYDPNRRTVRFWGYDGVTEHLFVISEEALKRVRPGAAVDEESMLTTFDANRDLIYATAIKVYARGRNSFYDLGASDF